MGRIVIDPLSGVTGHLRLEVEVNHAGVVLDSWISSTFWRGLDLNICGIDPRQAWQYTQRLSSTLSTAQAICSTRAIEDALKIQIPTNARLIRNLINCIQTIQSHVIRFYSIHVPDWVDLDEGLKADPETTSKFAHNHSNWAKSDPNYFRSIQQKIKSLSNGKIKEKFTNCNREYSPYHLSTEASLMIAAHTFEALEWHKEIVRALAILGSKYPHLQTFLVGGMATPLDPESQTAINFDKINWLLALFKRGVNFIENVYFPDVLLIASYYPEWTTQITGPGNFLSLGDFPLEDAYNSNQTGELFFPRGVILNQDLSTVHLFDQSRISEYITHSWFKYPNEFIGLHPSLGLSIPKYTGPYPPYDSLNIEGKYSWFKSPRYDQQPMEVGALARVLIAYANGHETVVKSFNKIIEKFNLTPSALYSTFGRTIARCIETIILANQLIPWTLYLAENIRQGNFTIHEQNHWDPKKWPEETSGWGFAEAPSGSLGHWIHISNKKIKNYQIITPSTWNASPRDNLGKLSPCEQSLIGVSFARPENPLEILRTIHSFDI